MSRRAFGIAILCAIAVPFLAAAAPKCPTCPRDASGRIARNSRAVREFKRTVPQPQDCHRCEVDHIVPLHRGGSDTPGNLQWLPRDVHTDKTRRER